MICADVSVVQTYGVVLRPPQASMATCSRVADVAITVSICIFLFAMVAPPAFCSDSADWRFWTVMDGMPESNGQSLALGPDGSAWVRHGADGTIWVEDGESLLST